MKKEYLAIWNLTLDEEEAALDRFHLRMAQGDFVELLGTENAGKSSLSSFFSGRARIRTGYVTVGGERVHEGMYFPSSSIQCVGEIPSVAESLTVAENIILLSPRRRMRGILRHRDLESRASFLLSELGLPIRAEAPVYTLTEGEKRAVEFLRALQNETPFVFVENIFENLGRTDMQLLELCLQHLKRRGVSILVISGGIPRFPEMSDRIVVMRGGRNVRTFYRGNFDRGEYTRWMFGVTDPSSVRAETLGGRGLSAAIESRDCASGNAGRRKKQPAAEQSGPGEIVFQARNISGEYLTHFDTAVRRGEIVGLYDMNNTANRELIHMITGERPFSGGGFYLKGKPFAPSGVHHAVQSGIGYIPGNILSCAVIPHMSYGENLALATLRRDSRFGFLENTRVLRFLEKEFRKEREEPVLSPQERMRNALQRLLLLRPGLLLMEDVISDMQVRMLKMQAYYLERLTEEGCAVLISSQNLTALRQVCDRIVVAETQEE